MTYMLESTIVITAHDIIATYKKRDIFLLGKDVPVFFYGRYVLVTWKICNFALGTLANIG